MLALLAVFLPLLGAFIVGMANRRLGDKGAVFVSCGLMLAAAASSVALLANILQGAPSYTIILARWLDVGALQADWALRIDALSVVMMCVVNLVSAMVHIYSAGYMSHDKSVPRFMSYLSLFTFFMLMLVTSDNLLQMFFGWEGVGLASYLLINFWFEKDSANRASIKAFLVNRVGDFGFILGIFACFMLFNSVQFAEIFAKAPAFAGAKIMLFGTQLDALTITCLLLFVGAMGKSAQLGLHTWLPDAMEGPTPVSALIHAATMVTAGVFMLCRLSPLFEYAPLALMVICILGALTAIIAATIGLTQFDIKRVIAYSTMSQLGYMFFAVGVSAYSAAMFHLVTHAFFKALLFLGAGSVIHALSGEQDLRQMGGLKKDIKATYALMLVGSLALAGIGIPGVYGLAGFYSKDLILESAFAAHSTVGQFAYGLGVLAAFMTAFYSWRLLLLAFGGQKRMSADVASHVHESPLVMLLPLGVLAVGALFSGIGFYAYFAGEARADFWGASLFVLPANDTVALAHHVPLWVKLLPLIAAVSGIILAYWFYAWSQGWPQRVAKSFAPIYRLFFNKYYFDELYAALFVRPAQALGLVLWRTGDDAIIDGLGPNGVAATAQAVGWRASLLQTGYVFHYAFAIVVGVVFLLYWLYRV